MVVLKAGSDQGYCEPCRRWARVEVNSLGRCFKCNSYLISPEAALASGLIDEETCVAHGGVVPRREPEDASSGSDSERATDSERTTDSDDSTDAEIDAEVDAEVDSSTRARRGAKDGSRARRASDPDRSDA